MKKTNETPLEFLEDRLMLQIKQLRLVNKDLQEALTNLVNNYDPDCDSFLPEHIEQAKLAIKKAKL